MSLMNWPASSVWVFIAQLVEHCSTNAEATGSNPVEAPKNLFFPGGGGGAATSQFLKLRFNCDSDILISFVLPQFTSFHSVFHSFHGLMNSINWPASSVWVFMAQLVEHCSANAEATGFSGALGVRNICGRASFVDILTVRIGRVILLSKDRCFQNEACWETRSIL